MGMSGFVSGRLILTRFLLSTMAGEPFKVGRFAHSLRVRLMREHLGVDVDSMYEEDLMAAKAQKPEYDQQPWDPDQEEKGRDDPMHAKEIKSTQRLGRVVEQGAPSRVQVVTFFR